MGFLIVEERRNTSWETTRWSEEFEGPVEEMVPAALQSLAELDVGLSRDIRNYRVRCVPDQDQIEDDREEVIVTFEHPLYAEVRAGEVEDECERAQERHADERRETNRE